MPLHPTSWRSRLIFSFPLQLGLPSGLFPSGFLTKTLYIPFLLPIRLHVPLLILLDLITRTICIQKYISLSSSLCSVLNSHLTSPSYAQIFTSTPCSKTPSAYVPPSMWATKFHTHTKTDKIIVLYIIIWNTNDSEKHIFCVFLYGMYGSTQYINIICINRKLVCTI